MAENHRKGEIMTDELQNDDPVENTEIIENPNEDSDLATGAETTDEKNEDSNAAVQQAINKQHRKYRDEERRRLDVETQLAESNRRLAEIETAKNKPVDIPEMPDSYDEDYEARIRERDSAIQRNAAYEAQQQYVTQQQQAQQQLAQQQQLEQINTKVSDYVKRATELGINSQELQEAGNEVGRYQLPEDVTLAILTDKDGPLITKYLAANPLECDSIRNMSSFEAAMHIERNVRAKAVELKPKTSNTPDPATNISGGGVDPEAGKYKHLEGVTYS